MINGVLLVDKPVGISSNRVLSILKRNLDVKKAGHGGCLDPFASGLLIVFLNEARKFAAHMLDATKEYVATAKLGILTDTLDYTGQEIEYQEVPILDQEQIQMAANEFVGNIEQIPPMFSALKKDGVALYKLARQGKSVEVAPREVNIHKFEILEYNKKTQEVKFFVSCSKGTYVRTLAKDLAQKLGTFAHLTKLIRTKSGNYNLDDAIQLDSITELAEKDLKFKLVQSKILPICSPVKHLKYVQVENFEVEKLFKGQKVKNGESVELKEQPVRIVAKQCSKFIGLGKIMPDGALAPKRLIVD